MKKLIFAPIVTLLLLLGLSINLNAQNDLIITGAFDGPLTGGIPKGVEVYVINDVADLSAYGLSSANNGGGTTGAPEFTFPAVAATAGDFIYLASETPEFNAFFGFDPDYVDVATFAINGDDAIELFYSGAIVDVFGDVNTDGTGQTWEYMDGWAYRTSTTLATTFTDTDWYYSGPNALDGETTNATAATPFPIGTFLMGDPCVIASFPFTEDFDGDWGTWCWTVVNNNADGYEWSQGNIYITPHSGTYTAHGMGNSDDYLISPELDLNGNFIVTWWDIVESSSFNNTYDVLISTTTNDIASFTTNLGTFDCTNTSWIQHTLDLSAYDGMNIFIAFHQTYSDATNYGFGLDDFAVRELSSQNDITAFSFVEQTGPATITGSPTYTVDIEVAFGTDRDIIIPTIEISDFASINPASGVSQLFSGAIAYTVTAEDLSEQIWTVNTTVSATQSSEKDILTFVLPGQTGDATFNNLAHTIDIEVTWDTNRSALTPTITISDLASIDPASGVANDFSLSETTPVEYTVTAEDLSEEIWTVVVTLGETPEGATCASAFDYGLINDAAITSTLAADDNIWYMFTLDQDYANVVVSACGSDFDTRLAIYTDCGDFAGGYGSAIGVSPAGSIAYDDDGCLGGEFVTGDTYASTVSLGTLSAGTYYAVLYGYNATSTGNTRFEVTGSDCAAPNTIATDNITATSTDITWLASDLAETGWNIKVNEAVAIDPTMVDGDIVVNDAVLTTPIYNLPTLTTETDYYVYIQSDCGSEWIEFMFTTPNACPVPENLMANLTGTDVLFSWDELGMSDWILEVSTTPLTDPTAEAGDILDDMAISGAVGEYALNSLATETTYYWYVQSTCGSAWATGGQFYVGYCVPAPTSVDGIGITNVTFGDILIVNNTTVDEAGHYGDYSAMIGDGQQSTDITVSITYETGLTYETKIWIDWNNDLVFDEVTELVYTGTSLSDNPTTLDAIFNIPLATPLGNYRMRIGGTDFADHDPCYTETWASYEDYTLEVTMAPACLTPTLLFADNITSDAATLNWTDNGETNWNLVAATASFDPTVSTGDFGLIPVGTNPFALTPGTLAPNTTYYWYIQADCGGSTSAWSVEGEFTTPCDAISILPFNETFNSDSPTESCWRVLNENADADAWDLNYTGTTYEGDQVAILYTDYNSGANNDYLVSPELVLTGNEIISYQYKVQSSGEPNDFELLLSTTGTNPADFTTVLIPNTSYSNTTYSMKIVDLSAYTGTVHIAWHVINGGLDGWRLYIDDVNVRSLSDENDIIDFVLAEQTGPATIDNVAKTVNIEVAMSTPLTALIPTITISDFADINPLSGVAQDFTGSDVTPFEYIVTSESGVPETWFVTVTEALTLSSAKDILTFVLPEQTGGAIIDNLAHTIDIEVTWDTDRSALTPTITISDLASIDPASGVVNDFSLSETTPVEYTVTAEDLSEEIWTVVVTIGAIPQGANCSNPFIVNIPADLTYEDLSQSNCGLGNMYENTNISNDWYDNGEDAIYEITVTADTYVRITLDPKGVTYTSLSLFDACPDTGALIDDTFDSSSDPRIIETALFAGMTYYAMIDSWPSPDCLADYDFTIEVICPMPTSIEAINLTATTGDIQWVAGGFETNWNLKVSSTSIDPTIDAADIFDAAVATTPLQAVAGLTAETDYYVYVQADCGSEWSTEYIFTTPNACPIPLNLVANPFIDNADLSWDELGVSDWNIKVSSTSIDPAVDAGDITEDVVSGTADYNVTGLSANTTYYWYVMSSCGSDWSVEGMFTTDCDIIATIPWTETFEDDSDSRDCWSQIQEAGDHVWSWNTGAPGGSISGANNGTLNASFTSSSGGPHVTKLVSPVLDLSTPATYAVEFYYGQEYWAPDQNELKVYYRISDIDPWVELAHYTETIAAWTMESIILPEASANFQIAFEGIDNYGRANVIDDVTIYVAPQIDQIDINNDVADITVCAGTLEADAIADFATTITITDTDATEHIVDVTWTIDTYDNATAADYNATGTFVLPAGVGQTDPATLLEVYAIVTVEDPSDPTFSFPTTVGLGSAPMVLPSTSDDAITGTWAPTTTATDVAGDIDYTFTPDGGQCANLIVVTITVTDIANPQIATIDFNSDVVDVEVCLGDDEATAIAALTSTITITDTDAVEQVVDVTWTIDAYDGNTVAVYNATGTFILPFGVDQTDPATVLEVATTVTVNELPVVTCPATIPMTADAGVTTLTGATPVGGVYSGTNVTAGDFDPTGLAIGAYTITYTYTDPTTGCVNSCDFNIDIVTDIETVSIEAISVYPNPNNGEFTIDFSNIEGKVNYQIYDTKGSVIVDNNIFTYGNTKTDVDFNLVPGVYYVKVVTTSKTIIEKIVVQ